MRHLRAVSICIVLACAPSPAAGAAPARAGATPHSGHAAFRLVDGGVNIDAGTLGTFTLQYPLPGSEPQKTHALVEKTIAGDTATLRYEGGGVIRLALGTDGRITLSIASMPGDVKMFRMGMLIDFGFSQGGTWQADTMAAQPFPEQKPARPWLYQGHSDHFTITSGDGQALTIELPRDAYVQLQDNREWDWKVFEWWFAAPVDPAVSDYRVTLTVGGVATPRVRVDAFGQSATAGYAGKVGSSGELSRDIATERRWLASLRPPSRDAYGGLPGSGQRLGLAKTGYFHVEQKRTRWWLVDPQGNGFFQLGVCAFQPNDDYTRVAGRRSTYAWLPPRNGPFRTAFRQDDTTAFSFHLANRIRKTRRPFALDDYLDTMFQRVRAWGFNSCGAFSPTFRPAERKANWPFAALLPLNPWDGIVYLPGIAGVWDPFDEPNRQRVETLFAERVAPHSGDPLLIGYFLANEPIYEDLPRVLPSLNGSFACKRRLVQWLRDKYATIDVFNRAWSANARSFDELNDRGLAAGTPAATADVHEFVGRFLDEYFKFVSETCRRYDPNHLLLGSRLQPRTINDGQLCRISAHYMDVISFNYYTYGIDRELLDGIHEWTPNRPLLLSEFFFASPSDSRLPGGGKEVASQQQRGLAYRNYVEQAAALGTVVGIEWFTLVDQSITGRYFEKYNGENANTGLISVTDRPYKAMLDEMIKTNYGIYDVLLGQRSPFVFDDPRFRAGGTRK